MSPQDLITSELPRVTNIRRRLHRIPELAFEEFKTADLVRSELDELKIPHHDGVPDAPTATIATIGDTGKPCIALRADIDALPILEQTNLDYCSTHPNCMHACGHDGHTATLLGTAAILNSIHKQLNVCVKLLFQPAEEGGGGAEKLVRAGALDGRMGPKVSAIFGLHGWPALKVGTVATKPGPLLANTDNFTATFRGKGTHGAYPHLGNDPITTAAEAVTSLQKLVSRETDPLDACVVTIGKFTAGTAVNIIPDTATIEATVRTLSAQMRAHAHQALERRMKGIALANNCQLEFTWNEGYPATVNDPAMADYVATIARQTFGPDRFLPVAKPSMGGEDFAYYLEKVPGCFFLIGVEPADCTTGYPSLHSDQYDFTDAALATGMRMFIEIVTHFSLAMLQSR
ncbi:MAG TPA: M20 family metallopeptidase [Tepidisphaeraceae bacterium]|jgi:amidohydrolase